MLQYKSPGVYIKEIDKLPPSISAVATAVPVFIGRTKILTTDSEYHNKPTRITSMLEYIDIFGSAPSQDFEVNIDQIENQDGNIIKTTLKSVNTDIQPSHFMFYALQMYFANGGGPCYIMSIGTITVAVANDDIKDTTFTILEEYDEPTLIVMPEAVKISTVDAYGAVIDLALAHCKKMQDRFTICDIRKAIPTQVTTNQNVTDNFRSKITNTAEEVRYGAAYFPYLRTSLSFVFNDSNVKIKTHTITKEDGTASGSGTIADNKPLPDIKGSHNDLYHSIFEFVKQQYAVLPPSSAVAGLYAKVDRDRGVWHAPANLRLSRVVAPMVKVTQDLNDGLNNDPTGKSVNPIREFTGKGPLVWGARTLDAGNLNWRFINVRREVIFIEESIKKALEHFVFQPNTANTWVKVKTMITAFLTSIWKSGGLAGAKAEDAFEVHIGVDITMTPIEIAQGIMNVELVLVPPRPAEVIVIKVSQKLQVS